MKRIWDGRWRSWYPGASMRTAGALFAHFGITVEKLIEVSIAVRVRS